MTSYLTSPVSQANMKIYSAILSSLSGLLLVLPVASAKDEPSGNVFSSLIKPVLAAKCIQCHGPEKDKGKLRMHTKEDLLKGGREVGGDIIVKGNVEDSELIFRITLPKDEDEAMPPFEDEEHYNPVTSQELQIMKAWIKLGASFDLLVSDLDESSRKAAAHVYKNMPKKLLSATAKLQPQLPTVPKADPKALEALREEGVLAMPIAQNTNAIYVNASYSGKGFDDGKLALLKPLSNQLLWLNLARTGVTDAGMSSVAGFNFLNRLHLENTAVTDAGVAKLSSLSELQYLNLYGTEVSDASVNNLAKLKKLEKVFLWQTKVTDEGADSLQKTFVDQKKFNALQSERNKVKAYLEKVEGAEEAKISMLEESKKKAAEQASDEKAVNTKCPVSNKDLDDSKFSSLEGRKVGFCCDKCKVKFDANPASFKSKIKDFKPSEAYAKAEGELKKAKEAKEAKIGEIQQKLGKLSGQLKGLGPEVNMGWKTPVSAKK